MSKQPSPLWPNPAPTGPISLIHRVPDPRHSSTTVFRVNGTDDLIIVLDGEKLDETLNRVYALGRQHASEDLAVDLAADALKELATEARLKIS